MIDIKEKIKEIIAGIKLESLHATHHNNFENAHFNMAIKNFIRNMR